MMSLLVLLLALVSCSLSDKAPNVVFIIADDMGWNDIGYHGSELKTPVLDKLAAEGIKLESHYTQPECSTTRASLLTSRYIVRTGLQADVILNGGGMALPLNETIWPQYMKELGYSTQLVGKWHQGANSWKETPVFRGFDYFYGYYGGQIHYFGHHHAKFGGHDFRRDFTDSEGKFQSESLQQEKGKYLTNLLTDEAVRIVKDHDKAKPLFLYFALPNVHSPNQSPPGAVKKYCPEGVNNYDRKQLTGNLGGLEESVQNLTDALKASNMWDNTLLVFISDNGGAPVGLASFAGHSNYPLRSGKTTLFEGGLRVPAFVSGPLVKEFAGQERHGMFHVADWMPTILSYVYHKTGQSVRYRSPLDGVDNSAMIFGHGETQRHETLFQHRDVAKVLRKGDYKLIVGNAGEYDGWWSNSGQPEISIKYKEPNDTVGQIVCSLGLCGGLGDYITLDDGTRIRLYNIREDMSETQNIAEDNMDIVKGMLARLDELQAIVMPPQLNKIHPSASHKKHGNIWKPWKQDMEGVPVNFRVLHKTEL